MAIKFMAVMTCDYPGCTNEEMIEAENGCKGPVARASKFYAKGWGYKVPTELVEGDTEWQNTKFHYKYHRRLGRTYLCPEHNQKETDEE